MGEFSGKTVLITGGASGIGRATALQFLTEGAKVMITDVNADAGAELLTEQGDPQNLAFQPLDVTSEDDWQAAITILNAQFGPMDILVNCAGIGGGMKTASRKRDTGDIVAHDPEYYIRIININLIGSFLCASKSAAGMMALEPTEPDGERGIVINTASVAAQDGQIGQVAYASSKGGILAMALPMARDLAREGIRVNTILPGFYETPIYQQMNDNVKDALRAHVQFPNRFGNPAEYAQVVEFMCQHTYINGEYIRTDAGARMPPR